MTRRDAALLAAGAATGAVTVLAAGWAWMARTEQALVGARGVWASGGTVTPLPRGDDRIPAILSEGGPVDMRPDPVFAVVHVNCSGGTRCRCGLAPGQRCPECGGSGDPLTVAASDLCAQHTPYGLRPARTTDQP